MDRFFVSAEGWDEARVVLGREESHHCLRVMRKRTGDRVEIFDGAGRWGRGVIAEESDGCVILAGLGINSLSMNAPLIPVVKRRLSEISIADAKSLQSFG